MRIIIAILIFFIIGALLIISNNDLQMYRQENIQIFSDLYMGWVDQLYFNIQSITGDVVNQPWLPSSNQNP